MATSFVPNSSRKELLMEFGGISLILEIGLIVMSK
jgi:hypothetical protein